MNFPLVPIISKLPIILFCFSSFMEYGTIEVIKSCLVELGPELRLITFTNLISFCHPSMLFNGLPFEFSSNVCWALTIYYNFHTNIWLSYPAGARRFSPKEMMSPLWAFMEKIAVHCGSFQTIKYTSLLPENISLPSFSSSITEIRLECTFRMLFLWSW